MSHSRFTFLTYLRCLFQLILSPTHGWEDISLSNQDPRTVLVRGLFPLAALFALTAPLQAVYHIGYTVTTVVEGCIIDFASIFVGYYLGLLVLTSVAPKVCRHPHSAIEAELSDNRLRLLAAYGMGLLALVGIVINSLPGHFAVLGFLPLYVAIILWRGASFVNIEPDRVRHYVVAAILGLILPWGLVQICF